MPDDLEAILAAIHLVVFGPSQFVGRKDMLSIKKTIGMIFSIIVIMAVVLFFAAPFYPLLYNTTDEVRSQAAGLLPGTDGIVPGLDPAAAAAAAADPAAAAALLQQQQLQQQAEAAAALQAQQQQALLNALQGLPAQ